MVTNKDLLTIFAKRSMLDVWQGSEYATAYFLNILPCDLY